MNADLDRWTTRHGATEPAAAEPKPRRTPDEVRERVARRMSTIDSLTPEQRMVVHEHGWNLVQTFLDHGVKSPKSMRALINAVTSAAVDRKDR